MIEEIERANTFTSRWVIEANYKDESQICQ